MKVTSALIKMFLQDQRNHGTETAIRNILWLQASEQMHDLDDVDRVRTYGTKAKSRQAGKKAKAGRNGKGSSAGRRAKPVRVPGQGYQSAGL